ncbi:MAG: hypothetical protein RL689_2046 [Planctomycetota bacterium]
MRRMADDTPMTACLLCQRTDLRGLGPLPALPDTAVLQCDACNAARLDPLPDAKALDEYYAGAYAAEFGAANPYSPAFIANKARKAADRWRFLDGRSVDPGRRLLEIGCAEGEFLRLSASRGLACVGIEPDARLAARASEAAGCPVVTGMFPVPLPVPTFTTIASFHVVEHVPDPAAFLRACVERLDPGGTLYIATPDLENTGYDLKHPVFRPCHLVYFSAASLHDALLGAGCREAHVVRTDVCGKPELKAIGVA